MSYELGKDLIDSIGVHGELIADSIIDKNRILKNGHTEIINALTASLDMINEAIQVNSDIVVKNFMH